MTPQSLNYSVLNSLASSRFQMFPDLNPFLPIELIEILAPQDKNETFVFL